ncbi:MAG: ParB/RepB/Spo0J family partition protein [Elusimicrobia bacterium]|nr:ParB/RepB/Spo0J family partition protein [Elusimicrobiota bacterium]
MRRALGRGLEALIPAATPPASDGIGATAVLTLPIERIRPNRLQPRKNFDPEKLSELAASIKTHGLAQPILVSYDSGSDTYELIAGERRLRASELAGLREVQAIVRAPDSDKSRLTLALIENLQREDLNPIESALGYLRLMKEFHITQTDLGAVVGKSKSAISNTLRLLDLPDEMQKAVQFGQLSEGHGRALLMIENSFARKKVFDLVLAQKLSVRQAEDLARSANAGQSEAPEKTAKNRPLKSADIRALENSLQHSLGTKVEIKTRKDPTKGSITLHFFSLTDFDKIINILKK